MIIRIIKGFYGLHTGCGVKAIGVNDKPIDVPEVEAKRLVSLGMAEYVASETVATQHDETEADQVSANTDAEASTAHSEFDSESEIPKYSADMKVSELRKIGKEAGITFAVGMTKEEMVDALDEHFYADELPELAAESPIEA